MAGDLSRFFVCFQGTIFKCTRLLIVFVLFVCLMFEFRICKLPWYTFLFGGKKYVKGKPQPFRLLNDDLLFKSYLKVWYTLPMCITRARPYLCMKPMSFSV